MVPDTHAAHILRGVTSLGWSTPVLPDLNQEQAEHTASTCQPRAGWTIHNQPQQFLPSEFCSTCHKFLNVVSCKERPHQKEAPPSLNSGSEMNSHSSKRGEKYEFMLSPAAAAQSRLPVSVVSCGISAAEQHNEPARAVNNITLRTALP